MTNQDIREADFREIIVKEAYARLYELGCTSEQVRKKLDLMSMFFGNIGAVSNMSDKEIGLLNQFLQTIKTLGGRFDKHGNIIL
jgi:hypothetical protein